MFLPPSSVFPFFHLLHLCFSLLTPPVPHPLVSVSMFIAFVLPHFLVHFVPSSSVIPPCILLQCLLVSPTGVFLIFSLCFHSFELGFCCTLLKLYVVTLSGINWYLMAIMKVSVVGALCPGRRLHANDKETLLHMTLLFNKTNKTGESTCLDMTNEYRSPLS